MKKTALLRIALLLALILVVTTATAQDFPSPDKAPHDIAYLRASKVATPQVKVVYGRPSLNHPQEQLTDKIEYGTLWRTGANEATEIKFYEDVIIGETLVKAGTYVLLTIPGEKQWEIILNSQLDTWGAFQYNEAANVARLTVATKKAERLSVFSIGFKHKKAHPVMVIGWDQTRVYIPLHFKNKPYLAEL